MKYFYILTLSIVLLNCSASKKVAKEEKCPKIYKNTFTSIKNERYVTVKNQDTASYFEVRYECVYSAFYTHKIMFDNFGRWDKAIYPTNKKPPILVWENRDLFSNGKVYNVYTNGVEEWKHIYASIMVFDTQDNDLLTLGSPEREKLTNYFANLLKVHDPERQEFFNAYWTMVDPSKLR